MSIFFATSGFNSIVVKYDVGGNKIDGRWKSGCSILVITYKGVPGVEHWMYRNSGSMWNSSLSLIMINLKYRQGLYLGTQKVCLL